MKNNTITQSGRSMIEMLGVLAIVGVLSVGGIAGYSKAMQKYRTNKTIEQVTQIINGVRTLYSNQKNYEGISAQYSGPLRKAKILPESAWESTASNATPKNPFGGNYLIGSTGRTGGNGNDNKAAELVLREIPDDACIELATQDWGAGEGLFAVSINSPDSFYEGCPGRDQGTNGLTACAGGSVVPLPVPIDNAISSCSSNNNNEIYFHFY